MLTYNEAKKLVEKELAKSYESFGPEVVLLEEYTLEEPFGWVFFYQGRRFIETGDYSFALIGNAPYIVDKNTGELVDTGTAYPVEHYIAKYMKEKYRQ